MLEPRGWPSYRSALCCDPIVFGVPRRVGNVSRNILVRMRIPVVPDSEAMLFWAWLPMDEEDSLVVRRDGMTLKLHFDLDCLKGPFRPTSAQQLSDPQWRMVWAEEVIADVTIEGVSDELAHFVTDSDRRQDPSEPSPTNEPEILAREYENLGERVYSFVLSSYNRLVAFARTEMGNHRLEEHLVDPSTMVAVFKRFGAKVRTEDSEWRDWMPTEMSSLAIHFPSASRHMDRENWARAGRFVNSEEEPSLFKELLAGAYTLAVKQHRRNALTEAVTALETAVAEFARSLENDEMSRSRLAENVASTKLRKRLRKVGLSKTADSSLSGSVRHLLPAILTEEQMPRRLLDACLEAVSQRNSVVHRGQRDVSQQELDSLLSSITETCFLLESQKTVLSE